MPMANPKPVQPPVSAPGAAGPPTESAPVRYPAADPQAKCTVEITGECAYALVLIEPHVLRRLQTRYPVNLDQKLWENVFRPALETSVF